MRIKQGVLGVNVYGSRHPMSKRTANIELAKIRKRRKTGGVHQPWGREMEPRSGTWNLVVLGTRWCMGFVR